MEAFLEDVFHAQTIRRFETREEAIIELRRLERLDWMDLQREIGLSMAIRNSAFVANQKSAPLARNALVSGLR